MIILHDLCFFMISASFHFVGVQDPVSNLTTAITCDNNLDIFWTAPYSIDVPSTVPDITYCVDIFNTSSTSQTIVFYSRCDINQTSHHVSSRLLAYAEYQVAVSAVNRIGSSSATSMTLLNRVKGMMVFKLVRISLDCWVQTAVQRPSGNLI